jgi:hypothetical protein
MTDSISIFLKNAFQFEVINKLNVKNVKKMNKKENREHKIVLQYFLDRIKELGP